MSTGLPCAAYPEAGPQEIITQGVSGVMDEHLKRACLQALLLNPSDCVKESDRFSVKSSVNMFLKNLDQMR